MNNAEQTRQNILEITADEIHQHGFKATSLSVILERCKISKGALYYHFNNKLELGYAVFEEIFTPMVLATWQSALETADPIEGLCDFFTQRSEQMNCNEIVCGCPLNNLCEEMANVDEGFRIRVLTMQENVNKKIAEALEKISDQLIDNIKFNQVAFFIMATFNGSTSLSKSSRNPDLYQQVIAELCRYLRMLKK